MKAKMVSTVTLGKRLGISTVRVKYYFELLGYLEKDIDGIYKLTEKGEKYGSVITLKDTVSTRLRWNESVVPILRSKIQEVPEIVNLSKRRREDISTRYAYVLELENNCYYVGSASSLKRRLRAHFFKKTKIKWIIKNPILRVAHTVTLRGNIRDSYKAEDKLALGLAKELGVDKVRGGKLSGHPETAPSSWNKMISQSTSFSKYMLQPWTNEELREFLNVKDDKPNDRLVGWNE